MSKAAPDKLRRDALGILTAAVAAQLAVSAAQQGLPALGPILASTFNLTTAGVGLLLGTISLGTATAVIFWGKLSDRINDRLIAVLGLFGTATCFAVAAFFKTSEVAHFAIIFAWKHRLCAINSASSRSCWRGNWRFSPYWYCSFLRA
jgi:predicted MFS family arabinose efflux permease